MCFSFGAGSHDASRVQPKALDSLDVRDAVKALQDTRSRKTCALWTCA